VFVSFGRAKGSTSRGRFQAGTRDISLLHNVKTALGPTSLLSVGKPSKVVKLTTHLHLGTRSRMVQLYCIPIRLQDNFTYVMGIVTRMQSPRCNVAHIGTCGSCS
jgi:hypothetical protein